MLEIIILATAVAVALAATVTATGAKSKLTVLEKEQGELKTEISLLKEENLSLADKSQQILDALGGKFFERTIPFEAPKGYFWDKLYLSVCMPDGYAQQVEHWKLKKKV